MNTRTLGSSTITVGEIGLGCMPMNWAYVGDPTEAESIQVIHRALDLGATLLDTADVYGPYANEELLGRALERGRERAVLATKTGLVVGPNGGYPLQNDARPEHIREAVVGSLRRLRTDVIDLYQLHRIDPNVPLEESWGTMAELVAAGTVRALGMSEASVDELARAHAIHPVASVQSELSLWFRERLDDVVPWCAANDAAFIPYAPLGSRLPHRIDGDRTDRPRRLPLDAPALPTGGHRRRTARSSIASGSWPIATDPRLRRSHSPGCCPRRSTSFRSPERGACVISRTMRRRPISA